MILMRYSKINGGQFISHLDVLRHIAKTLKRAGITVKMSQGFNPHPLIFMSAPIGVGMQSYSEYCLIETDEDVDGFKDKFNLFSPLGIKCMGAWHTDKKINIANDITIAEYLLQGINNFNEEEFMSRQEVYIEDRKGNEKNIRDKIFSVKCEADGVKCALAFASGLRAEKFADLLVGLYGGTCEEIIKLEAYTENWELPEKRI